MIFEKGAEVQFIELEQNDICRRFVIPYTERLEEKIRTLISSQPSLALIRIGTAIVTKHYTADERLTDGVEGIPSAITASYELDFCGNHPILAQGPARYSENLIEEIRKIEITSSVLVPAGMEGIPVDVPKPKVDLASSFKEQLGIKNENDLQNKLNKKLTESKVVVIPRNVEVEVTSKPSEEPVAESVQNLSELLAEKRKKHTNPQIRIMEPRPEGKLDVILRKIDNIERMLSYDKTTEDEPLTGAELQEWFHSVVAEVGEEKAFVLLAKRIKE